MKQTAVAFGRRSPKWSVLSRLKLTTREGLVYLERLRLIQTPWFGVFLHHINSPDPDPDPHDHPWNFTSIVLSGGYVEKYWTHNADPRLRGWGRFSRHRMTASGIAHQIAVVKPKTWTLIIVGPRIRNWGFWTQDGWVPWQEYEQRPDAKQVVL